MLIVNKLSRPVPFLFFIFLWPLEKFEKFLPIIKRESTDSRNFVKKAVNWALRQIGKRSLTLNRKAVETAREIEEIGMKSSKWIASDALRELTGEAVQKRLRKKASEEK